MGYESTGLSGFRGKFSYPGVQGNRNRFPPVAQSKTAEVHCGTERRQRYFDCVHSGFWRGGNAETRIRTPWRSPLAGYTDRASHGEILGRKVGVPPQNVRERGAVVPGDAVYGFVSADGVRNAIARGA